MKPRLMYTLCAYPPPTEPAYEEKPCITSSMTCYFPYRYSAEDGPEERRMSAQDGPGGQDLSLLIQQPGLIQVPVQHRLQPDVVRSTPTTHPEPVSWPRIVEAAVEERTHAGGRLCSRFTAGRRRCSRFTAWRRLCSRFTAWRRLCSWFTAGRRLCSRFTAGEGSVHDSLTEKAMFTAYCRVQAVRVTQLGALKQVAGLALALAMAI